MSNLFATVQRQKMKLRMALTGVSGGGKTLGALYLAYGLTDDWGKVALIDTERERGRAYASRSDLPIPRANICMPGCMHRTARNGTRNMCGRPPRPWGRTAW